MKVILQVYPTVGSMEEAERYRPIGRNNEMYQRMLADLSRMVRLADELGVWGITHVEHHFHSEGLELSPHPGLLNLYLGMQCKQLRMGQLGYVVPSHDPIRLAEEIAMVDHMLQGRYFVGLARGYQTRWTNVIGQKLGITSTASDGSPQDIHNRRVFEEHYRIMKAAWANDVLTWNSDLYQVPYPADGIPNWPPKEFTAKYGAPGEMDDDGTVRGASVVPKPYTEPHPKLFQAFSVSARTIQWCAEEGVVPTILAGDIQIVTDLVDLYERVSNEHGYQFRRGENVALVRGFQFSKDRQEAHDQIERYDYGVWNNWYRPFGFSEAARWKGEEGPVPKPGETLAGRLLETGLYMGGTPDDIKRQLSAQLEKAPCEYLVWLFHIGLMPTERALEDLETMMTKVIPAVSEGTRR